LTYKGLRIQLINGRWEAMLTKTSRVLSFSGGDLADQVDNIWRLAVTLSLSPNAFHDAAHELLNPSADPRFDQSTIVEAFLGEARYVQLEDSIPYLCGGDGGVALRHDCDAAGRALRDLMRAQGMGPAEPDDCCAVFALMRRVFRMAGNLLPAGFTTPNA
jgi:hypothetical protein